MGVLFGGVLLLSASCDQPYREIEPRKAEEGFAIVVDSTKWEKVYIMPSGESSLLIASNEGIRRVDMIDI